MRPLYISISAFGAYADEECIDFSQLLGQPLLLIHGPTGSGKSTVLDAICFALFGDTSGAERSGQQMRNELADTDRLTEITYDFGFQGRVYRVRRSPAQERPKARGEGMTSHSHAASLWERTGVTGDEDGQHLVSGSTKVGQRIEELFGFSSQQFRQVVMLPQGQFRRLLMADSQQKEEILKKLFGTALFERVTNTLVDRANTVQKEYRESSGKASTLLAHAEMESVEVLEGEVDRLAARREDLVEQVAGAGKELGRRQAAHKVGLEVQAKLTEQRAAADGHRELAAQESTIKERRAALVAARRARPLMELLGLVKGRERDLKAAQTTRTAAASALKGAELTATNAQASLDAEKTRDSEREEAGREVLRLEGLQQRVADLGEAQTRLAAAQTERGALQGNVETATVRITAIEGDVEARDLELVRVRSLAETAPARELEHQGAQERLQRGAELDVVRARVKKEQVKLGAAKDGEKSAEAASTAAIGALEALWERWRSGQAAVLAGTLTEGEPCPVCGANEHPHPAEGSSKLPTDDAIEQAKAGVDACEDLRRAAEKARGKAAAALDASKASAHELARMLGDAADAERAEQRSEVAVLHAALMEATEAGAALPKQKKALDKLRADLAAAKASALKADAACRATQGRLEAAQAVADERRGEVPEALRAPGALAAALKHALKQRDALRRALEVVTTACAEAGKRAASAKAEFGAAEAAWRKAQTDLGTSQDQLAARRVDEGLADDSAFSAACIAVPEISAYEEELRAYDASFAAAADRLTRANDAAEGLQAVDVPALEAAVAVASSAHGVLLKQSGACAVQHADRVRLLSEVRAAMASAKELDQRDRVLGGLAEVARGRGRNQRNLSFQRFVLAVLLDDVLLQASERLHRMTDGRYRLERSTVVAHKGKAAGLDLEVSDSYSGKSRSVATLSGGESFLAALSLSLGLVDVVQAYSGGVQLDALFIDEGFGTLDAESLERAIEVLTGLNAEGRLIGIISHVAELKQRIGTRLAVIPTDRGSRTQLVVG